MYGPGRRGTGADQDVCAQVAEDGDLNSTLLVLQESRVNNYLNILLKEEIGEVLDFDSYRDSDKLSQMVYKYLKMLEKDWDEYIDELVKKARL